MICNLGDPMSLRHPVLHWLMPWISRSKKKMLLIFFNLFFFITCTYLLQWERVQTRQIRAVVLHCVMPWIPRPKKKCHLFFESLVCSITYKYFSQWKQWERVQKRQIREVVSHVVTPPLLPIASIAFTSLICRFCTKTTNHLSFLYKNDKSERSCRMLWRPESGN